MRRPLSKENNVSVVPLLTYNYLFFLFVSSPCLFNQTADQTGSAYIAFTPGSEHSITIVIAM